MPISPSKPEQTDRIESLLWWKPQQNSHNSSSEDNPYQSSPTCPNILEIPSLSRKTHPQIPQLPQHPYLNPHLLMMPPHLIFHTPQRSLLPYILPLTLLMHLLMSSLFSLIPKANFLGFIISRSTGQSFEVFLKYFIDPQWRRCFCLWYNFSDWLLVVGAFAASVLTILVTKHIYGL